MTIFPRVAHVVESTGEVNEVDPASYVSLFSMTPGTLEERNRCPERGTFLHGMTGMAARKNRGTSDLLRLRTDMNRLARILKNLPSWCSLFGKSTSPFTLAFLTSLPTDFKVSPRACRLFNILGCNATEI